MKKGIFRTMIKAMLVMLVFFMGTCSIIAVDVICAETTGDGGKFVLDVENWGIFN